MIVLTGALFILLRQILPQDLNQPWGGKAICQLIKLLQKNDAQARISKF